MKNRLSGGLMKDLLGIHTPDEVDAVEAETNSTNDTAEDLDGNGLPGQSIIDLVEKTDSLKKEDDEPKAEEPEAPKEEPAKDDSKENSRKEDSKKEDSKKDDAVPAEDDDVDYFFEEEPKVDDTKAESTEPESSTTKVVDRQTVDRIVSDDTCIRSEKGDNDMNSNEVFIADLMTKYDSSFMIASVAELKKSGGKSIDPQLFEIVEFAIKNNTEVRKFIAGITSEIIREYPENIKEYQKTVFEVARDVRVKFFYRCPEYKALFETKEAFEAELKRKGDTELAIDYCSGTKKLQETWYRTDENGKALEDTPALTEAEVRKIVLGLPKEVQDETCDRLHILRMVVKKKTGDKKPEDKK